MYIYIYITRGQSRPLAFAQVWRLCALATSTLAQVHQHDRRRFRPKPTQTAMHEAPTIHHMGNPCNAMASPLRHPEQKQTPEGCVQSYSMRLGRLAAGNIYIYISHVGTEGPCCRHLKKFTYIYILYMFVILLLLV